MDNLITIAVPTADDRFRVEADSSNFANGAILSQCINGKWRPVAFRSQSLSQAERNYEIYDKEMLAIMAAIEEWRPYLLGASQPFEIWTDHRNLQYFRKPQKLNYRQARWVVTLQDYDFQLSHRPGALMTKADLLSRRADHYQGEDYNRDVVLLKPEVFAGEIVLEALDADFVRRAKRSAQNRDREVVKALVNRANDWEETAEGLVVWKHRLYVPKDDRLRADILKAHHDAPTAGHPGRYKMQELITRNYWWPGISRDCRLYVDGCDACQRNRPHRTPLAAPLNPNAVPKAPWEVVSVDLIGELPESQGYNAICVFVDRFSKQIHLAPVSTTITSPGMAKLYRDQIFRLHGIPRKFIHDRGPQFESRFMRDLYKLLGIEANPSTAYHPQTDGQTERINQEVELYLRTFINHRQSDWADWLALAEFAYNDKVHTATGSSPFFVNYGLHPNKGTSPQYEARNESAQEFSDRMAKVRDETAAALKGAAETMKRFYDRSRRQARQYQPGDQVLLEATHISSDRPSQKLGAKRYGPFKIVEKVGASAFKLELPPTWRRVHPVFNEALLSPYIAANFDVQMRPGPPPPILLRDEEEFEVERILDSRMHRRGRGTHELQYLVKWKGYGDAENTWEPAANLEHARRNVDDFHRLHPSAPRPIVGRANRALFALALRPRSPVSERTRTSALEEEVMSRTPPSFSPSPTSPSQLRPSAPPFTSTARSPPTAVPPPRRPNVLTPRPPPPHMHFGSVDPHEARHPFAGVPDTARARSDPFAPRGRSAARQPSPELASGQTPPRGAAAPPTRSVPSPASFPISPLG